MAFFHAVMDRKLRIPAKLGNNRSIALFSRRGRPPKPKQEQGQLLKAMLRYCENPQTWRTASNIARILQANGQYRHLKPDTLRKEVGEVLSDLREVQQKLNFVPTN